ncbi:Methionine aminopeptidase [bioreactor metagenome]|uniref:Methionine aminopeptidase n=1 Tax=bioreactor metagenome TaxID=1076179 RepID=A0A644W4R0_9ZZZZ
MTLKEFRRSRLQLAAKESGAQVLLASLPQNITYTTNGYVSVNQFVLCSTQSYVIYVPQTDRFIYVVGYGEIPSVLEFENGSTEIFSFGSFRFCYNENFSGTARYKQYEAENFATPEEALTAALNAAAKPGDQIAFDYSRAPYAVARYVSEHVHGVRFIDGVPVFSVARRIKFPEEIAGIEKATNIAEDGLLAALYEFRPGDTEQDLERSFLKYIGTHGAQEIFFVATANLRAAYSDTVNQPAPIGKGSMIRFDFGCKYDGYTSDLARTACVGKPDEKVSRYYDAVFAGTVAAIAAVRPGVPAENLFEIAMKTTRERGIPHYRRHHVGHGIGLEIYDYPSMAPGDHTVLEENMVINIETPYYELGWGGVQIEDTVAITADGCRVLDRTDKGLLVID